MWYLSTEPRSLFNCLSVKSRVCHWQVSEVWPALSECGCLSEQARRPGTKLACQSERSPRKDLDVALWTVPRDSEPTF